MSVHCQYNIDMRKVFRNGNSLAVTLPRDIARELRIRDGSRITWEKKEHGLLLVTPEKVKKASEIDPEVARLIKKISQKYKGVWQDLAKV